MLRHGLRLLFLLLGAVIPLCRAYAQLQDGVSSAVSVMTDTLCWQLRETGLATYYSARTHGRKMASGERYDKNALFCAHRTLPFGTRLRLVNKKNNKAVEVVVKDRGPFSKGRLVDLSNKAAEVLGMLRDGVVPVEIWVEKK